MNDFFYRELNKAYSRGISNPRNAKAIKYIQEVSNSKDTVEKLIYKEIDDERE